MRTVGLCGLGNMGSVIAGRLSKEWPVLGFDLDETRRGAAEREHGVRLVDAARDLADADVVVFSLPTPQASLAVLTELPPGTVVVETSTVNPADMRRGAATGARLVDAAILSGVSQAAAGTAPLLVGGAPEDVDAVWPVLTALSEHIVRCGELGSGMAAKVINNAVAHAVMVVLAEAGAMAAATGVSRAELAGLLGGPDGGLVRPLTHRFTERVLRGDYDGGMPTEAARKDSTLALALAQDAGVPLFAVQAAHTVYELGVSEGLARLDYSAIATLWERWTGQALADPQVPSS
ncbi:MAG: NAD-binding protein [Pseudonocardiaceae bacterium]|nr:NAD-binding protein [Pseudonocardiaceae bacterium]